VWSFRRALVEGDVDGQAHEPGLEGTLPEEGVESPIGPQERFLGGVGGVLPLTEHPVADPEGDRLMAIDQRRECGAIATLRARHQRRVIIHSTLDHGCTAWDYEAVGHDNAWRSFRHARYSVCLRRRRRRSERTGKGLDNPCGHAGATRRYTSEQRRRRGRRSTERRRDNAGRERRIGLQVAADTSCMYCAKTLNGFLSGNNRRAEG